MIYLDLPECDLFMPFREKLLFSEKQHFVVSPGTFHFVALLGHIHEGETSTIPDQTATIPDQTATFPDHVSSQISIDAFAVNKRIFDQWTEMCSFSANGKSHT